MQSFQYWVQEYHLCSQLVSKNTEELYVEMCKMFENWGYLIKGSSYQQCVKENHTPCTEI